MTDTTTRKPRRWVKVLAWTGGVLGVLVLGVAAAGFYFLYAPATPEPELAATVTTETIAVDGMDRTYTAVVPANVEPGAPLFVALHGNNMDAAGMREATGYQLDALAVEHGFVVVYGQGYENSWHDCRNSTPYTARLENIDDVTYLETVVADVVAEFELDASRVFGLGYSNGAHMLYRMAAESAGTFAGIEVNAANYSAPETYACEPLTEPVPVILVEGTADPLNPYEGGKAGFAGQDLGYVLSAQDSALMLAELNGVADDVATSVVGGAEGEAGAVTLTAYGADTATPVLLYTVEGGGHVVANPVTSLPRLGGGTTEFLNAPAVAWEVFSQLP